MCNIIDVFNLEQSVSLISGCQLVSYDFIYKWAEVPVLVWVIVA